MSANESETRARTMGWLPKEQYKGPEEHWLDANAYLKRGDGIMPILQANNKKLSDRLATAEAELQSTKQLLSAATESIDELKNFRSTLNVEKVKSKKAEVLSAIAEAKKSGDTDVEVQLTDQLTDINASLKEAEKPPVKESKAVDQPQLTPAAQAWMGENPWFGTDKRRTALAMAVADEWKSSGKILGTKEFFDHVDTEVGSLFDKNAERREAASKVDSTNNSSGDRGNAGRSYADLPREAKEACDKAVSRLVGAGRAYKTKAEWQKAYVDTYDWS